MTRAPSIEDAVAVAQHIGAEHQVEQVFVFGSVARGESVQGSDIDLMVVVNDDASADAMGAGVCSGASVAAQMGQRADIEVYCRSKWDHLRLNVSASFAAGIARYALELFNDPARRTVGSCDSPVLAGVARNNSEVAVYRLVALRDELRSITPTLENVPLREEPRAGESDLSAGLRIDLEGSLRCRKVCAAARRAIELSLQAVVAVEGTSPKCAHTLTRW